MLGAIEDADFLPAVAAVPKVAAEYNSAVAAANGNFDGWLQLGPKPTYRR